VANKYTNKIRGERQSGVVVNNKLVQVIRDFNQTIGHEFDLCDCVLRKLGWNKKNYLVCLRNFLDKN